MAKPQQADYHLFRAPVNNNDLCALFGTFIPLVIQESVFGYAGIPAFSSALKAPY
jgi:hypothetical protein